MQPYYTFSLCSSAFPPRRRRRRSRPLFIFPRFRNWIPSGDLKALRGRNETRWPAAEPRRANKKKKQQRRGGAALRARARRRPGGSGGKFGKKYRYIRVRVYVRKYGLKKKKKKRRKTREEESVVPLSALWLRGGRCGVTTPMPRGGAFGMDRGAEGGGERQERRKRAGVSLAICIQTGINPGKLRPLKQTAFRYCRNNLFFLRGTPVSYNSDGSFVYIYIYTYIVLRYNGIVE